MPPAYLPLILPHFYTKSHYNFEDIFDDLNARFSNNRFTKIPENKQYFSQKLSIYLNFLFFSCYLKLTDYIFFPMAKSISLQLILS